jgi:acetyltransferase-like isoleucine patch superfamily enzyme
MTSSARIEIGDRCGLSGTTLCAAALITIGSDCLFGADTLVTDNDHHALVPALRNKHNAMDAVAVAPVRIGSNVFIGARAIILKGTSIGDGAVIGAGAVVTGEIPPNVIAVGNPARAVSDITAQEPTD